MKQYVSRFATIIAVLLLLRSVAAFASPPQQGDPVTDVGEGGVRTLRLRIEDYRDDAEECGRGNTIRLNDAMHIGGYMDAALIPEHAQCAAFRFPAVELPADAEIEDAYLAFVALTTAQRRLPANLAVRAELGDAAAYTMEPGNLRLRRYGTRVVAYRQEAFVEAMETARTPNLKELLEEVRQAGWQSGQALAFLIEGDNYVGSVYPGGTDYAPELIIHYRTA